LEALADKYRRIAALRQAKSAGQPDPPRRWFAGFAAQFPGVLRELDTLTLDDIAPRERDLRAACERPETAEAWMRWVSAYHLQWREVLRIKRHVRRGQHVDVDL